MRKLFYLFICILPSILIGCKKDTLKAYNVSSLNVINASEAVSAFSVNFTFTPISYGLYQSPINYGRSSQFGNPTGELPLELISSQDTLHSFYKNTLNLRAGGTYSFYVIGQNQPEAMLLEDHIPSYQDSTSGVRFINLSPDSKPVTINLQGNPASQTEFTNLAYKQITDFKGFSVKMPFFYDGYTFEIRDAATGNLLTTFFWYMQPFSCNTLVISGLENDNSGNFPLKVFQVNHY